MGADPSKEQERQWQELRLKQGLARRRLERAEKDVERLMTNRACLEQLSRRTGPLNDAIINAAEAKKEVDDFGKAMTAITRTGAVVQKTQTQSIVAESLRRNAETMHRIMRRAPKAKALEDVAANLDDTRAEFAEVLDATRSMQEMIENGDEEEEEIQIPDTSGKSGYEASLRERLLDVYRLQITEGPSPPVPTGGALVVTAQDKREHEAPDIQVEETEAEDGDDDDGDSVAMERVAYHRKQPPPPAAVEEKKLDHQSHHTKPVAIPPSPSPPRRGVAKVSDAVEDDPDGTDVNVYGSSPQREPVVITTPLPSPPPPLSAPTEPPRPKQVSVRRL